MKCYAGSVFIGGVEHRMVGTGSADFVASVINSKSENGSIDNDYL